MGRRVAVMGTGTWGTAFSLVLADAGCEVAMWGRRAQVCEEIRDRHRNPEYLPEVALPVGGSAGTDPADALAGAELVVLALPAQTLRQNLGRWRGLVPADAVLVSLMKGIELASTRRMSQVVTEVAGVPAGQVAVVSGPNLAREIAARQPTATVVACTDGAVAEEVAQACSTPYFRPYTNTDVVGTELGGAVKK